ncbi:ras-related protein Rab-7L1-like isoform X2 [Asterias rubens]|uniref:ras-related protein Rab-7L1-like isoform X2 n=1 Tax=Asterias rubens TaxID=7604 RepID=UPI0014559194|nr:ras-related protein Rab-7L1-like isoform X2 [Asterias rubens]
MNEKLFKVIIVGDSRVGKTAFVDRYVHNRFNDNYKTTVGVDFALKKIQRSEDELIRVQLWDIAGQERFSSLTRVYYKDASACVIMFDVTSIKSFEHVVRWKNDVDSKVFLRDMSPVPCLLLGNKSDLDEHKVSDEEVKAMSQDHNFVGWSKISVKDSYNVEEPMMFLVEEVVARLQSRGKGSIAADFTDDDGRIKLPHTYDKQSKCCWIF